MQGRLPGRSGVQVSKHVGGAVGGPASCWEGFPEVLHIRHRCLWTLNCCIRVYHIPCRPQPCDGGLTRHAPLIPCYPLQSANSLSNLTTARRPGGSWRVRVRLELRQARTLVEPAEAGGRKNAREVEKSAQAEHRWKTASPTA